MILRGDEAGSWVEDQGHGACMEKGETKVDPEPGTWHPAAERLLILKLVAEDVCGTAERVELLYVWA